MKSGYLILFILPLVISNVIELDPNNESTHSTGTESQFTFYISLDELPKNSSSVINLFTETKFSLTPLYKKFSQDVNSAKSVKENEDEFEKIVVETFSDGQRFRILFKKTDKKQHYLSMTFRKDKDTKIYFPELKFFAHKETTMVDIIKNTHKIKANNPIYFYIHLKSIKNFIDYEIKRTGESLITLFVENLNEAPTNIYHIDESINTFNFMELIEMNRNRYIMEIFSSKDTEEKFSATHTQIEYYRTLNWESHELLISTHQIIPKNKNDIHKFILNKDSIASRASERYFVNIIHLSGSYNIDYNVYGKSNITSIKYDKIFHKGNNLISVKGDSNYVFTINCLSKVCLINFQLIRVNTDKMTNFKFTYYTKYFYIFVENKRTINLDVETDYINALNSGNYKLYMKDLKGNPVVVENKHKINEFIPLVGKQIEIVVKEPTLFLLYHRQLGSEYPYDDVSKFKDVLAFRYQINSASTVDAISAYIFKQPFNLKDFTYTPHLNRAVGKLLTVNKQLNIDFFNPYLHYDSDVNKNYFAFSTCKFEKTLKEEDVDLLFYTNRTNTFKLKEMNLVHLKTNSKYQFLLPLDHDIRNETIEDYTLIITVYQGTPIKNSVFYSIVDYIDYHFDNFDNVETLKFGDNGRTTLIVPDINLAKVIRFESQEDCDIYVYYTYIQKNNWKLLNVNKFDIQIENKKKDEMELSIHPFLKSINIDSEYNVYISELNEKTNLESILETKPFKVFYDANVKEGKIKFNVPIVEEKKYYIVVYATALDNTQLDKSFYSLYYDPNPKTSFSLPPLNTNVLIGIGGCLIVLIAFCYLCCCGSKKKDEKEDGKELDELDEYKKV